MILAFKHFQQQGNNFNKHAKYIIIDKLVYLHGSKETLQELLVVRENFWIQKLKTLAPFGLKGTVMQIEKALINDRSRVSKVS